MLRSSFGVGWGRPRSRRAFQQGWRVASIIHARPAEAVPTAGGGTPLGGSRTARSAPTKKARAAGQGGSGSSSGAPAGIRTPDPVIKSHLLYQLSYGCRYVRDFSTKAMKGRIGKSKALGSACLAVEGAGVRFALAQKAGLFTVGAGGSQRKTRSRRLRAIAPAPSPGATLWVPPTTPARGGRGSL
jgi:hypothetical protein